MIRDGWLIFHYMQYVISNGTLSTDRKKGLEEAIVFEQGSGNVCIKTLENEQTTEIPEVSEKEKELLLEEIKE